MRGAHKDIRRATRRHFAAEDKIRIVLEGFRGDDSIAELCRKEGIAQSLYYTWSKEFMEAGKRRLAGDTARAAISDEVKDLRRESRDLKDCVADLTLENRLLEKNIMLGEEAQPVRGNDENRTATTYEISCRREGARSSGWSNSRICQPAARWTSSTSRGGPSTAGMIATMMAGRRVLSIDRRRQAGCGTGSRPGPRF
jgi:transposase